MRLPQLPQPSTQLWQTLNHSILLRYILLSVCGGITVFLIHYFYNTIALFTAAGIFAALLNYPVVWLSRYLPRGLAIALVFLSSIALLLGLFAFVGLQILTQGQGLLIQLRETLNQQNFLPSQELLNQLDIRNIINTLQTGLATSLGIVRSIFSSVFTGIFGAVISLYMLIDGRKLWQMCLKLIPVDSRSRFATIFQQSFLGFIRGQLLIMLFLSSTSLLAFTLLKVNYSLLLAVIVGVLDAIPGIGAILGIVVVTALVFVSQGSAITLKVLLASILLEQIQENYVRPKVMGDTLDINPVLLFLALFIGQRVAGLLGIFLAIPIAGMIALWLRTTPETTTLFLDASEKNIEL